MVSLNNKVITVESGLNSSIMPRYIKDESISGTTYEGWANANVQTSEPFWQIKRTLVASSVTQEDFVGSGEFKYIWDERAAYYGPVNRYSFLFDGVNDRLYALNALPFTLSDSYTISMWLNTSVSGITQLVGREGINEWKYYLEGGKLRAKFYSDDVGGEDVSEADTPIPLDEWVHIAATFGSYAGPGDVSGVTFYVNGSPSAKTTVSTVLEGGESIAGSAPLMVMRYPTGGIVHVDNLAFITGVLGASDIANIYALGATADIPALYPTITYWDFEDPSGYPYIVGEGSSPVTFEALDASVDNFDAVVKP